MKICSETFFNKLTVSYDNGEFFNSSAPIHTELYEALKSDLTPYFMKSLQVGNADLKDEMIQETAIALFLNMQKFLVDMRDKPEKEKVAFIFRLACNKKIDIMMRSGILIRKTSKEIEKEIEDFIKNNFSSEDDLDEGKKGNYKVTDNESIYIDNKDGEGFSIKIATGKTVEGEYFDKTISDDIMTLLDGLFAIKKDPANLIAFFYSNVIMVLESETEKNGKPKEVHARLKDKTLFDIRKEMPKDLMEVTNREVPEEAFKYLDEKLKAKDKDGVVIGSKRYDISVKDMTGTNGRIREKMNELYGNDSIADSVEKKYTTYYDQIIAQLKSKEAKKSSVSEKKANSKAEKKSAGREKKEE